MSTIVENPPESGIDKYPDITKVAMVTRQHEEQGSIDTTQDSDVSDIEQTDDEEDLDGDADADDDDEDDEGGDEADVDCADLLERAHDRIARQQLQDEVQKLKELLERKDVEIERLAGQLRRAIATKSELVEAHTDLEKYHQDEILRKDTDVQSLRRSNIELLEEYSNKEKALLNELVLLTEKLFESEKRHREERADMNRRHTNEMLEKDFEIAQLTVKLQVMTMKDDLVSTGGKSLASKSTAKKIPPKLRK